MERDVDGIEWSCFFHVELSWFEVGNEKPEQRNGSSGFGLILGQVMRVTFSLRDETGDETGDGWLFNTPSLRLGATIGGGTLTTLRAAGR